MVSSQLAEETVQVALMSSGPHANLAIDHLCRHFGLKTSEAEALLARGCGVISPDVPRATAGAAIPVLSALGLQVALLPKTAEPIVERFDLSLRLKDADALHLVRPALKRLGWTGDVSSAEFRGPAGLEIVGLPRAKAEEYSGALRSLSGVNVTLCPQSNAAYDVFAPTNGLGRDMAQILTHISVLACSAMDNCPPIAINLDRRMLNRLLARFPKAGLIGVNQAFQRYHLTLTGPGRISSRDLVDFLATRGCSAAATTEAVAARRGLRLESMLTRAAARQFVADYAMIGMTVRADLVRA
jgi:hypothetical protein